MKKFIEKAHFIKLKVESFVGIFEHTGYLRDEYELNGYSESYSFRLRGDISRFISKIDFSFEEIEKVLEKV